MSTEQPRAERCETCRFWQGNRPTEEDDVARENVADLAAKTEAGRRYALETFKSWKDGTCHRLPPAALSEPDDCTMHRDRWPCTAWDDWCGEWRAKGTTPGQWQEIKLRDTSLKPRLQSDLRFRITGKHSPDREPTLGEVAALSWQDLYVNGSFGKASVKAVEEELRKHGAKLRGD